ncbi:MAG TPA: helix-turn-helix domain-containing protein [Balneolaceae bacterium]|nr:helix-turn-helix domain-containing protein [Balneolaceae bacterium]
MTEYKPSQNLVPYVEFFWDGQFNINQESLLSQKVVPNGYIELIIHTSELHCHLSKHGLWSSSPDYTIIGLFTSPYEVRFRDKVNVFGIRFKPEAIYNLFGIPASEFYQQYEDMELVLGTDFQLFCSKLREAKTIENKIEHAETYLIQSLQRQKKPLTYVNHAAEIIRNTHGFIQVEELYHKVFISLRQLQRQFKIKVGISPKMYMRISRLNAVQQLLEEKGLLNYTHIAFICGYADQAHFIRDFKSIIGERPGLFTTNSAEYIVNANTAVNMESDDEFRTAE